MQRSVKKLTGYTIHATDGDLGKVEEFYFDDQSWTIRFMVVNTGGWLGGRKVLISPHALGKPDWKSRKFPTNLSMEQVRNSPDIDTDKPVNRQYEERLYKYYSWPSYWGSGVYNGGIYGMSPLPAMMVEEFEGEQIDNQRSHEDVHLRSTKNVTGYHIQATDGEIGHIEDFIMDDESWSIRYLVVNTRNFLPGRKVIVPPQWINAVSWFDAKVYVSLSKDAVRSSPQYYPAKPINVDYEKQLHSHYRML